MTEEYAPNQFTAFSSLILFTSIFLLAASFIQSPRKQGGSYLGPDSWLRGALHVLGARQQDVMGTYGLTVVPYF